MQNEIKLGPLNLAEASRYMGFKEAPDEKYMELIKECEQYVLEAAVPRYIYRIVDFDIVDNDNESCVIIEGTKLKLTGKSITTHLRGCRKAVLMAVTISEGIDRLIRKVSIEDMTKALMVDCLASTAVEQVCDRVEEIIKADIDSSKDLREYGNMTFRFGLGYGDLPIELQKDFVKVIDASKRIGLMVSESNMLTPTKSVTAVIGLSDEAVLGIRRGCASCNMRGNCQYRAKGGRCND